MPVYPRVAIEFCTACKWNLRAAWYLQELLSTFGHDLGEVALIPAASGVFRVTIELESGESKELWDRKKQNGFPDSKELKQLVRNVIDPSRSLGHSDTPGGLVTDCTTCQES
ncbi:hypothetical protein B9G98_00745 [Wickerhamiella sorbophila]|uniref:Selenoprotein W n=1 Tax=Wickerhamiella sorbophila TaxID=45607 RepID=A0A2T0FDT7_9ASCO|nr:hypothetical protein B9G98_00745 [Wickerhamiella sorbophila]PRT53125.1 hypothetical protein B9G98_00745 [Wickerhamiella sorbophila]